MEKIILILKSLQIKIRKITFALAFEKKQEAGPIAQLVRASDS